MALAATWLGAASITAITLKPAGRLLSESVGALFYSGVMAAPTWFGRAPLHAAVMFLLRFAICQGKDLIGKGGRAALATNSC
jgi:hypothetical protein